MAVLPSDVVMMERRNQEVAGASDEVRQGRRGGGGGGPTVPVIDEWHRSFVALLILLKPGSSLSCSSSPGCVRAQTHIWGGRGG